MNHQRRRRRRDDEKLLREFRLPWTMICIKKERERGSYCILYAGLLWCNSRAQQPVAAADEPAVEALAWPASFIFIAGAFPDVKPPRRASRREEREREKKRIFFYSKGREINICAFLMRNYTLWGMLCIAFFLFLRLRFFFFVGLLLLLCGFLHVDPVPLRAGQIMNRPCYS